MELSGVIHKNGINGYLFSSEVELFKILNFILDNRKKLWKWAIKIMSKLKRAGLRK